ncbi:hypothetical protein Tco_0282561 [Tanacetum coccineum]
MRLIKDIKELLEMNSNRLSLFSNSCFGVWLNVPFKDHDPFLIHSMLLNQQEVDEYHTEYHDLQFNVYKYILKFGRREFYVCTGLKFGHYDLKPFDSTLVVHFRDRVFGHANVTVLHLKEAFDGDDIRNAAWIHYRHVNVSDGAGEGGGKVGKLEKLKKKTWVIEILPKSHIWFSKVNDNIVPRALRWHVKIRFGRESYENLFGGFDHDFQSETRQLELTKVEQNQYWWVESERYFKAHRLLFRPNDLPPPKPIKNSIPRKPERANVMPISTTIWDNAAKEIAELKDINNNWSGFGEVDLKVLVTRLANLESRMNGYDLNKNGGYCDRDIRMDFGVGMQDHSRVDTGVRMDTVVRMDTGFRMSSGGLMDSGVGEMPDLNFREGDAMDDCNFGLNSGWLNSMSTPQGQFWVFSTPSTQVNMAPQFQDSFIRPVHNSTTIREQHVDVVMEDVLREKQPGRIKKMGPNLLPPFT